MKNTLIIFVCLGQIFGISANAQSPPRTISIDSKRPYVDVVFERYGKRRPVFEGDGELGVWLRLRNNCILPLKVYVLRRRNENEGVLLVHRIFEESNTLMAPPVKSQVMVQRPNGYVNTDLVSLITIESKASALFSVPLFHVTRSWDLQIEIFLQDPSSDTGKQPRVFVNFDWFSLSKEAQVASDKMLFGHFAARP